MLLPFALVALETGVRGFWLKPEVNKAFFFHGNLYSPHKLYPSRTQAVGGQYTDWVDGGGHWLDGRLGEQL